MRRLISIPLIYGIAFVSLSMPPRHAAAADKKIITLEGADVGLPFSPAVASGDFIYLAGTLGNIPGERQLADGFEAQMKQTMSNIEQILAAAGVDFSHVVSSNVFLSDARYFPEMNAIYREYFKSAPPIRATVQADIALPGALVEIAMIATRAGVDKEVIRPSKMKSPELPYSWGIRVGNTLFIAGATARNPDTYQPIGGNIDSQTKRVLENIGLVLDEAGMSYEDIVRCNVFIDDPRYFSEMNEAYRAYFPTAPPARATVRTKLMNTNFLSEIQCTAVQDPSRRVVAAQGATRSTSPYSPAILVGNRLYVAGMVGRGPDGYAIGDIKAQTRQTIENIEATLRAAEMTLDDVVDVMVYVADMRDYQAMNEAYAAMMPDPPPPRATVGAPLMSTSALVEIVVTAQR